MSVALTDVVAAATGPLVLSGLPLVDGVNLTDGQRVLLPRQVDATQNGIWLVHSGAWTRPDDYATGSTQAVGTQVAVDQGYDYAGSKWAIATQAPVLVDIGTSFWEVDFFWATEVPPPTGGGTTGGGGGTGGGTGGTGSGGPGSGGGIQALLTGDQNVGANLIWVDGTTGPVLTSTPSNDRYRIRLIDSGNPLAPTIQAVPEAYLLPDLPLNFLVTAAVSLVTLQWNPPTTYAAVNNPVASYNVYRNGVLLASVTPTSPGGQQTYLDTTVTTNVTYTYTIASVNVIGESAHLPPVTVTPSSAADRGPTPGTITFYPDPIAFSGTSLVTVNATHPDVLTMTYALTATVGTVTPTTDPAVFSYVAPSSGTTGTFTATISDGYGKSVTATRTATFVSGTYATAKANAFMVSESYIPPASNHDSIYTLGIRFYVTVACQLTAARVYWMDPTNLTTEAYCWSVGAGPAGTLLGSTGSKSVMVAPNFAPANRGFNTLPFPTPINLVPGTMYVLGFDIGSSGTLYPSDAGRLTAQYTARFGPLYTPATTDSLYPGGGGCFHSGATGTFPESASTTWYGIDPLVRYPVAGGAPLVTTQYWSRWNNGFPNDPNWFPLVVWDQDPAVAAQYAATGMNVYGNFYNYTVEHEMGEVAAAGMHSLGGGLEASQWIAINPSQATTFNGYQLSDEADMSGTHIPVATVHTNFVNQRKIDSSRMIWQSYGKPVAEYPWANYGYGDSGVDMPLYLSASDIVSADWYGNTDAAEGPVAGPWAYGWAVDAMKMLCQEQKPVWVDIETEAQSSGTAPTVSQVQSAAWLALAHGANGIGWFVHQFSPSFDQQGLLDDATMKAAVTTINTNILSIAPALNSRTIEGLVSVSSSNTTAGPVGGVQGVPIVTRLMQPGDGYTYIIAAADRPGTATATFTLNSSITGTAGTVLFENRSFTVTSGSFTDTFAADYSYHVYKLPTTTTSGGGGGGGGSSGGQVAVNLTPIDGGPNYYANTGRVAVGPSAANWDDPTFFPVGVWYGQITSSADVTRWQDLNLNTAFRTTGNTDPALLRSGGIWAFYQDSSVYNPAAPPGTTGPENLTATATGSETVGLLTNDEPFDVTIVTNAVNAVPDAIQDRVLWWTNSLMDPFIYGNESDGHGGTITINQFVNWSAQTPSGASRIQDIFGLDYYWCTWDSHIYGNWTPGPNSGGQFYQLSVNMTKDQARRGSNYGTTIDIIRKQQNRTGGGLGRPIYVFVENGQPYAGGDGSPTGSVGTDGLPEGYIWPKEMNAAIWAGIIHGARMVIYFNHSFTGGHQTADNFADAFYQTTQSGQTISIYNQAKATNTLIKTLAPVINSPYDGVEVYAATSIGGMTQNVNGFYLNCSIPPTKFGGVDVMCKWYGGHHYLFANYRGHPNDAPTAITFNLANSYAGTATRVDGVTGSYTITAGSFTANMGGNDVLIVRID